MVGPKQTHQVSGAAAICIGFGAIFVLLIGLLIWQPKASIWIAEAIEAEFTKVPDMVGPARFAQQPKRMPIDSREGGQPFDRQPSSREKAPQKE